MKLVIGTFKIEMGERAGVVACVCYAVVMVAEAAAKAVA